MLPCIKLRSVHVDNQVMTPVEENVNEELEETCQYKRSFKKKGETKSVGFKLRENDDIFSGIEGKVVDLSSIDINNSCLMKIESSLESDVKSCSQITKKTME